MGNIPACTPNVDAVALGPYVLVNTFACDEWAVPHILNIFWIGIITRDPTFAFLIAGLNEALEVLFQMIFGSFVLYVNANYTSENLAGALVDDFLIQGGIGATLSLIYIWIYDSPRMWRFRDLKNCANAGKFFYYLFFLLVVIVPGSILFKGVTADGFAYGILIYPLFFLVFTVLNVFTRMNKNTWKGYTRADQAEFWIVALVYTLVMGLQALADYFYSSAVQSWLWSFIFLVFLIGRAAIKSRNRNDPEYKLVSDPGRRDWDPFKKRNRK